MDDLSITVGQQELSGWQSVRVTLSADACPNTFDISATEKSPGNFAAVPVNRGDACVVKIGGDTVVTGYVDSVQISLSAESHEIRIAGRGTCADIVDCSAITDGMSIYGTSIVELAKKLTEKFGITVIAPDGDGKKGFNFTISLGETPFEILERVARYEGFLLFEDQFGQLVIARAGSFTHNSGFTLGVNVQSAVSRGSSNERYSDYIPQIMSPDRLFMVAGVGNSAGPVVKDDFMVSLKRADGAPRYRPHIIISAQVVGAGPDAQNLAELQAQWESNRRAGRSDSVEIVCDSWRDQDGLLWTQNFRAPLDLAPLRLSGVSWVIAEVTFARSAEAGTTASLRLMPPAAFLPEPYPLQAVNAQIARDLDTGSAAAGATAAPGGTPQAPRFGPS